MSDIIGCHMCGEFEDWQCRLTGHPIENGYAMACHASKCGKFRLRCKEDNLRIKSKLDTKKRRSWMSNGFGSNIMTENMLVKIFLSF